MDLQPIILIAFRLGVDAFSVAVGIGASDSKKSWPPVLRLASAFGGFQLIMPVIGRMTGPFVANTIVLNGHWVAFSLLVLVGGKMIWEALRNKKEEKTDWTKGFFLLLLSIATSIAAITFSFDSSNMKLEIILPAITSTTCFLMTIMGMSLGKTLARLFDGKVEIFGGVVLITVAGRILMDHAW
jgi:manganese efflux pump family protein